MAVRQEYLIDYLSNRDILRPKRDVWGVVDERLVLLRSGGGSWEGLETLFGEFRLSVSDPCASLWEIHTAYGQASTLDVCSGNAFNDMREIATRCSYLLYSTAAGESAFLENLYQKLLSAFQGQDLEAALKTIRTYYDCGRSVSQAAAALYIHKNTLQYRVRRFLEALDLTKRTGFQQEYLVRLLLEHHKRKQGLRALE